MDVTTVNLGNLAEGAAADLFQVALADVLTNLRDPNTDWKARRGITLTFLFSVDEERTVGAVEIRCGKKLAGVKGVSTPVYIGRHEGRLVAVEGPKQTNLFPSPEGKPRPVEAAVTA